MFWSRTHAKRPAEGSQANARCGTHYDDRFVLTPTKPGKHCYNVEVTDLKRKVCATFALSVTPRTPEYLFFPGHASQTDIKLNWGVCPIHKDAKYAKVSHLEMDNRSTSRLAVSATSNLTHQLLLFADAQLTTPFIHVPLEPQTSCKLFIALKPRLSEEVLQGHCRSMECGIRLKVQCMCCG